MDELLAHARTEYARMLALPFDVPERAFGQRYMTFLRDFIAQASGVDGEAVQTSYEARYQWQPRRPIPDFPPDGKWLA